MRGFWKTVETSRPVTSSGEAGALIPATVTAPVRVPGWKLGTRPLMRRSSVDLPQPLGPHSRMHSPDAMRRLTSSSPGTMLLRSSVASWDP